VNRTNLELHNIAQQSRHKDPKALLGYLKEDSKINCTVVKALHSASSENTVTRSNIGNYSILSSKSAEYLPPEKDKAIDASSSDTRDALSRRDENQHEFRRKPAQSFPEIVITEDDAKKYARFLRYEKYLRLEKEQGAATQSVQNETMLICPILVVE